MSTDRIDVHTHVVPPFWAEGLQKHGGDPGGWAVPQWNPDLHLKFMDDQEIATSMLSLTAPSIIKWPDHQRHDIARKINEYVSELTTQYPGRFGNFATLPLPDVERAVQEAQYALDQLGADGIVLMSNYEGVYLGDARYRQLWETLNQRSAVVFIHPIYFAKRTSGLPAPIVEYPCDTTINAVHMVYNGVLDKYPNVKIILSHAGGFVPYAVLRFCMLSTIENNETDEKAYESLLSKFKLFYFDIALSAGKYAMASLLTFANPERILFGSDFPYAPLPVATQFTQLFDKGSELTETQKTAINNQNATKLLSTIRSRDNLKN